VGCESEFREVFAEIRSVDAPEPGTDTTICYDSDPFVLTGFSPLDGIFTGSGVEQVGENQWLFDPDGLPSAGYTITYNATVNGCPTSASRFIAIREAVGVDAGFAQQVCFGDSLIVGNNNFPTEGSWSFYNESLNSLLTVNDLGETVLDASILEVNNNGYQMIYTATDEFGCEGTDLSSIFVRALPDNPNVPTIEYCGSSFGTYTISNYNANLTYEWYDDEFENTLLQENNFQAYQPSTRLDSTTSVYVKSRSSGCYSDLVEATAIINDLPEFDVTSQIVCLNNFTFDLNEAVSVGGGFFYTDETTTISTNSTIYPEVLEEGNFLYYYEVTSNVGCKTRSPFQISIVSSVSGDLLPEDTSICRSEPTFNLASYTGLYDGSFSGPGVEFNFLTLSDVNSSTNQIAITYEEDDNGCIYADQQTITILSSPDNPTINGDTEGCDGDVLEFFEDDLDNVTYKWSVNGDTTAFSSDQNVNVIVGEVETLELLVYNAIGCPSNGTDEVTITSNTPQGSVTVDDSLLTSGDLGTLNYIGDASTDVTWSFTNGGGDEGQTAQYYFYADSTIYIGATVSLTNSGCTNVLSYDSLIQVTPITLPEITNSNENVFNGNTAEQVITIYPVPAMDVITIHVANGNSDNLVADVFDTFGNLVLSVQLSSSGTLDISSLTSGRYQLILSGNETNVVTPIIKL